MFSIVGGANLPITAERGMDYLGLASLVWEKSMQGAGGIDWVSVVPGFKWVLGGVAVVCCVVFWHLLCLTLLY